MIAYDPAFAFEIAHIIESGLSGMYGENPENVFYLTGLLLSTTNRMCNRRGPGDFDPEGLLRGIYRYRPATERAAPTPPTSLASGVAMPSALRAAEMLAAEWDVAADVWSVTSWSELGPGRAAIQKEQLRHPGRPAGEAYVREGPLPDRRARSSPYRTGCAPSPNRSGRGPGRFVTLGTDGFGFSDTRPAARRFFNTDAESQVVAVLEALAREGQIDPSVPVAAARQYRIDDVHAAPAQTSDPGPGA